MDLLAVGNATTDTALNTRVNAALQITARQILNEAPDVEGHDQRVVLAWSVINTPGADTPAFIWRVVTWWQITPLLVVADGVPSHDGVTDEHISNAVSAAWDDVAALT